MLVFRERQAQVGRWCVCIILCLSEVRAVFSMASFLFHISELSCKVNPSQDHDQVLSVWAIHLDMKQWYTVVALGGGFEPGVGT